METISNAINRADSSHIVDSLLSLKAASFPNREWLLPTNHYKQQTTQKLRLVPAATNINPNSPDLKDYISTSSILHCLDGWTYLSQSLTSFIDGNPEGGLHLAYYAELRAALSFLASQGIGVFENEHYYIKSDGNCVKFNVTGTGNRTGSGTHQIAWSLLEQWSQNQNNAGYFLSKIKVRGLSLSDWITSFLGNPATTGMINSIVVKALLSNWSLDIAQFRSDRDVRNFTSYRPQKLNLPHSMPFDDQLKVLIEINRLLEPGGISSKYKLLDTYILKQALAHSFDTMFTSEDNYDNKVDFVFSDRNITDLDLQSRLRDKAIKNIIFSEADKPSIDANDRITCLPVICRALLLLRISTMACEDNIKLAGLNKSDLGFWIKQVSDENGLGDFSSLSDLSDLWADKGASIVDVEALYAQNARPNIYEANLFNAYNIWELKKVHSSCFWGLGL